MLQLRPRYRGQTGQPVDDPLTAAGATPELDLGGLARLFTSPALRGEFAPSSFLSGVELVWPPVAPAPSKAPLCDIFSAALNELCAEAATIEVSLSGGLDSITVLRHVLALRPRRRVLAFVVDLVDDDGMSTAAAVRLLLANIGLTDQVQLVVVDPAQCSTPPVWSPYGPRPDALPVINASVAQLAADTGVSVLLSGDGADELLTTPRFATMQILHRIGAQAAWQYLTDMTRSGPGFLGEVLAMASHALPALARTRLYWAANWPEWSPPTVSPVLAEPLREPAHAWARQWLGDTLEAHSAARRSWGDADAYDAWWPRNYRPPSGSVPEASPFLHPEVVAAALALPLADRYDPAGRTVYQRTKAQVVKLLPSAMVPLLPTRKQTYRAALSAAFAGTLTTPIAVSIGLLDPDTVAQETDTATRMMATAVENWLAGMRGAGVILP